MRRVVILGRGGAGKSVAAVRLGRVTGLPVVELDRLFWRPDLTPTPAPVWLERQREIAAADRWIIDGDLGPYDTAGIRLSRADTVLVLDFALPRCAWRAARRSRERAHFWWWLLTWRRRARPVVLDAIAAHAAHADVHILRRPRQLDRLLAGLRR